MTVISLAIKKGSYLGLHSGAIRAGAGDTIAIGGTNNYDFDVSDFDGITVLGALNATALGDLGLTVEAFATDGTVVPVALTPAVAAPANVLAANIAYSVGQYDVRGITQIRVAVKNNNAAAKVLQYLDVLGAITGVDF